MKIAFVTSSLEAGRDGVGDYTRLLAAECARRGHAVSLLALSDGHVVGERRADTMLRLGAKMPWERRERAARDWLAAAGADRVSLQFVCYGFHPRGIDFGLGRRLGRIACGLPVQVMLHELWIGCEEGARLKDRLLGWCQRRTVLGVLGALRLTRVHASNGAYVSLLRSLGIEAVRLPLFGSVPVPDDPAALGELSAGRERDAGELMFGMFGTLHPVWPQEPLLGMLCELGGKVIVEHAGRIGAGDGVWRRMVGRYGGQITFRRRGEMPPDGLARWFAGLDFGIAATPWEIIGKSAAVAAMLEHGLPVIVNRDDVRYPGWREAGEEGLIQMGGDLVKQLAGVRRRPPRSRLPDIADWFLASLGGGVG